jgi:flavodoxin I
MSKIAVVYGSTTGNTTDAAKAIAKALGGVPTFDVTKATAADLASCEALVLGTSTWGYGDLQDDWEGNISLLAEAGITGKKVALFGMGDQQSYSDTYVDGMGRLYDAVMAAGALVVGFWPTAGYEHTESKAVRDGAFVGLALDQDNQPGMTVARIQKWTKSLVEELA